MISLAIWAQLNLDISSLLHVAGAGLPHMSGALARIAGPLPLVGCYPQGNGNSLPGRQEWNSTMSYLSYWLRLAQINNVRK